MLAVGDEVRAAAVAGCVVPMVVAPAATRGCIPIARVSSTDAPDRSPSFTARAAVGALEAISVAVPDLGRTRAAGDAERAAGAAVLAAAVAGRAVPPVVASAAMAARRGCIPIARVSSTDAPDCPPPFTARAAAGALEAVSVAVPDLGSTGAAGAAVLVADDAVLAAGDAVRAAGDCVLVAGDAVRAEVRVVAVGGCAMPLVVAPAATGLDVPDEGLAPCTAFVFTDCGARGGDVDSSIVPADGGCGAGAAFAARGGTIAWEACGTGAAGIAFAGCTAPSAARACAPADLGADESPGNETPAAFGWLAALDAAVVCGCTPALDTATTRGCTPAPTAVAAVAGCAARVEDSPDAPAGTSTEAAGCTSAETARVSATGAADCSANDGVRNAPGCAPVAAYRWMTGCVTGCTTRGATSFDG
jgi:hypothetical protein